MPDRKKFCPGSLYEPYGPHDDACPVCGQRFKHLARHTRGADRSVDIPRHTSIKSPVKRAFAD